MENRRVRNYLIFTERTAELDALLPTLKADIVEYAVDHYKIHFKTPVSPSVLQLKTGCLNVRAIPKRKPKIQENTLKNVADEKPKTHENTLKKVADGKVKKGENTAVVKKFLSAVNSFYQEIFKKYEKKLTKGYAIQEFLNQNKMEGDFLEKPDYQVLQFYRTVKDLANNEAEAKPI